MLVEGGDPDVADELSLVFCHARLPGATMCQNKSEISLDYMSNNSNSILFGRVFELCRLSF
jgi:hypothetical protein